MEPKEKPLEAPEASGRIIVALDGLDWVTCREIVVKLKDRPGAYKVHDLWDRQGPTVVNQLKGEGAGWVWVDMKLKDIPNTVKLRARAAAESFANILTVHASGGIEMMQAALEGFHGFGDKVLAVTVLTSLSEEETHLLHGQPAKAAVLYQARLAKLAGVHGIVCSPQEVGILAKRPELQGMKFVVPGIRPAGSAIGDQKRVDTPAAAIAAGVTHLVVGRPITEATDPVAAFDAIAEEIAAAMAERG